MQNTTQTDNPIELIPGWQKRSTLLQVASGFILALLALLSAMLAAQGRLVRAEDSINSLRAQTNAVQSNRNMEIKMLSHIQVELAGVQARLDDVSSRLDRMQARN